MCAAAEHSHQRGFSLVEVLCAVAIASSAIVVLTGGITNSLRSARSLDLHLGSRIILQSILDDELSAANTAPGLREGDSGPYRWQLVIEPVSIGVAAKLPASSRMYRLTASVSWDQRGSTTASVLKLAR